ncbi:outer dense fiber protein 3-like protein 2a isoform X1 [Scleropages formosus]|uniref:outer dense fiber protein 3-like protein 2a isoform X1 n=1 Tax=Scleropages formosus TaxID=113540 RepID=UPI00087806A6|nr:outer dense fiber protein 3-like protein 2 isoform X1 [Scleropages formosus]
MCMLLGPGPGRYSLPTTIGFVGHDFTKPSSPAYSFHSRMSSSMYFIDSSPGPQYHIDGKMTRFGRDGVPAFTMQGRSRGSGGPACDPTPPSSLSSPTHVLPAVGTFQTPGPGAYSPEAAPPLNNHQRPPSYTMGSRTRYRSVDAVPAPNRYTLPALMGCQVPNKSNSASYTIAGRCRSGGPSEDLAQTPGPGKYNRPDPGVYLPRQPAYSMLGRHSGPRDGTQKPGPGAYSPERVMSHKRRSPSYSMGIRHSEFVTPLVVDLLD